MQSLSVCLKAGRGCSPGHVPERRPAPVLPKQRGVHQSAAGGGGWEEGVLRQAAISSRLNSLRPCSSAQPPQSHALQLRGLFRRQ